MKLLIAMIITLSICGYFTGVAGKRLSQDSAPDEETASSSSANHRSREQKTGIPSTLKSSDTAASLAEIPGPELYDRLALWLLDASAIEMQEFWASYSVRPDRSNDLNDLVFINWARVDPEAAITAAEGTEFSKYPWWAWACHEPEKALAEVLARYQGEENNSHIGEVMWGIGEFHPEWLREHIDELPEKWMRDRALSGYRKWADTDNPRASIEFLKQQGGRIDPKTLAALGRESPLEAFDLAMELQVDGNNYSTRGLPQNLIKSLAEEDPALLKQLEDHAKSPKMKMDLKLKQFEALVKTDPAAAQKQVEEMPESWVKQDQLAMLANHYLKTNPGKSLEIATKILGGDRDALGRWTRIHTESGSSGNGVQNELVKGLMQHLIHDHAAELMEASLSKPSFSEVQDLWVESDLPGFAGWVTKQDDSETYNGGAHRVVRGLKQISRFDEAMEWAESISTEDFGYKGYSPVLDTYQAWRRNNPEAANAWKENADLSDGDREKINQFDQQSR